MTKLKLLTYIFLLSLIAISFSAFNRKKFELRMPTTSQQAIHIAKINLAETSKHIKKPNFSAISEVKTKKTLFFEYLYPFVAKINYEVLERRVAIENILKKQRAQLTADEVLFIKEMSTLYLNNHDASDTLLTAKILQHYIRVIPPSLALAQAANESAWGVSRFAVNGNNYFGQWCFERGCGLVPNNRSKGLTHEVRTFKSPEASVRSYIRNLNTHPRYCELREIRHNLFQKGHFITGLELAEGLGGYSEQGKDYINELQSMIRVNNLIEYDLRFWESVNTQ